MPATLAQGIYTCLCLAMVVCFAQGWPPTVTVPLALLAMPCLAVYFHLQTPQDRGMHKRLLLAALVVGGLIDGWLAFYERTSTLYRYVILLRMVENLMIAYLFYSEVRLLRQGSRRPAWGIPAWVVGWVLAMAAMLMLAFWLSTTSIRATLLPYVVALILLTLTGINRIYAVVEASFQQVLVGLVLFVLSNFVSTIDRFLIALPYPYAITFALYAAGFYMIVQGFWLQYRFKPLP